ncbi:hypothetical protein [Caldicellulosiruptor morganii]|uniref:CRISPR type III A-associated protein Csm2 n=1 Tax=Caldicellulosiruptor morganii TaxID=1387555 RepID=A0ABY7BMJ6_9FIRM|nr:hypothetical protein [Caldicellulosiruptor morganii]WAM33740.1 hypothetical protein OTK00_002276 [Caldicellulosiruptor morganii]
MRESFNFNFDEIKESLEKAIKENQIKIDVFEKAINNYKKLGFELEKILEFAAKNAKDEDKVKLWALFYEISLQNISELCDRVKRYGESLKNSELYKRFYDEDKKVPRGIAFRILELTRLGKREEVFYVLLREFVNAQQELKHDLVNAFNPKYSIENFKILVYSFMSGLLG